MGLFDLFRRPARTLVASGGPRLLARARELVLDLSIKNLGTIADQEIAGASCRG